MEKVTLRDVAEAAGVSIATASWAVNDNRDVQITQDEAWRNGKILLVVDTDGRKDVERRTFSFMFEHQVEGIIGLATMY